MATCSAGDVTCFIVNQANIINNIATSVRPIEKLIIVLTYVLGLVFAFKAIYSLKVYGESKATMSSHSSAKEPLLYLLVASVFIYFPSAFQIIMNTTFGYSSPLAYSAINSDSSTINTLFGAGSPVGSSLVLIIQVIGLVAFIKGWLLVSRSSSQGQPPGGTGKGLMHVFGGVVAMNIVGTLQILDNTLYG
jgi:intracellular multiplication protein IcmC